MNAQSLQSVLVLLAQSLGPFGQTWVFHKFTENGEFYIVRILTIRHKNRDAWAAPRWTWPWLGELERSPPSSHPPTVGLILEFCRLLFYYIYTKAIEVCPLWSIDAKTYQRMASPGVLDITITTLNLATWWAYLSAYFQLALVRGCASEGIWESS